MSLTTTRAGTPTLPALLEFHSPSAALAITPVRGPARGIAWVCTALVMSTVAVAGILPVDKVVTASGRVVSRTPNLVVQPLETAIVRQIDVTEGQTVHAGDVLARLDPTFAGADVAALEQQVASLQAEVDRLAAEARGEPYRPAVTDPLTTLQASIYAQHHAEQGFKLETYRQKISGLESAVARAEQDAQGFRQRLTVALAVEGMRRELESTGSGSKLNSLSAQDNRLEVQRSLINSLNMAESGRRDLDAMRAERDGYVQNLRAQAAQDLSEQSRKLSDAREQLHKASLRNQLVVLRAEQDATVQNIAKVSVGSVLQSGDQFLTLVPLNAQLEVEANVAGGDAGFVHEGNPVTIKFDTFQFVKYGSAEGEVRTVSPDSFVAGETPGLRGQPAPQPQPGTAGGTFYRTRVTLDEVKLHDTPPGFRITPGMPVTTDIKVGKRTVLSYLLSRVLPVALDGMREP